MNTPDYDDLLEHTDTVVLPADAEQEADVDEDPTVPDNEDEPAGSSVNDSHVYLT